MFHLFRYADFWGIIAFRFSKVRIQTKNELVARVTNSNRKSFVCNFFVMQHIKKKRFSYFYRMTTDFLNTPIAYLKGVGPQKADLLGKELGIFRFDDLLHHFPFRYVDRTRFHKISELLEADVEVQLVGKIVSFHEVEGKGRKRLSAIFADETGAVELVWFQSIRVMKQVLQANVPYVLFGKPTVFNGKFNFPHPELELLQDFKESGATAFQPVYNSTEKLNNRGLGNRAFAKLTRQLFPHALEHLPENLPAGLMETLKLMGRKEAFLNAHFPKDAATLERAKFRIKFEESFYMQLVMQGAKVYHKKAVRGYPFKKVGPVFNAFYQNNLPFDLTEAQKRVLREIRKDLGSGAQMNRLIQGDVGSGKTIVALLTMLMAVDNGFQSCLMAPTEILAQQHYEGIAALLEGTEIKVGLLTGSTKVAQRRALEAARLSGELHILIGTHALLEPNVTFQNLGLAIIDEQHRFGVKQRAALLEKNTLPPHVMVMTATPIPRTLAMTVYGDLDVSVIDELPPGRKPIKTLHLFESNRLKMFGLLKREVDAGRQAYIVYPLINESEKMDFRDLMEGYTNISRAFPPPRYQLSIVHGQMKPDEKDFEMKRFVQKQTQIMVATTVIEVGVNVPNASVMVIESAERFGLSQLHQLRGRVGRGADASYCILMTGNKLSSEGKTRMETMVRTQDGFEIADVDMRLRGPGDILGTRQSGVMEFKMIDLVRDGQLIGLAREWAIHIIDKDPKLEAPEHLVLRPLFAKMLRERAVFGRVG